MAANVWKILLKKSLRFIKYANFDGLQEKYHRNPSFPPLGNEDEPPTENSQNFTVANF